MAKKRSDDSKLKWKKKTWFDVLAPSEFNEKNVGEITADAPEDTIGRVIKVNLKFMTGNVKNKNYNAFLKVRKASASKVNTEMVGYEIMPNTLKRFVRKRKSKIDDSFIIKTKDDSFVRVKPILITKGKATNSKKKAIRRKIREELYSFGKENTYDDFVKKVVNQSIPKGLQKETYPIFPVTLAIIAKFRKKENLRKSKVEKVENEIEKYMKKSKQEDSDVEEKKEESSDSE